MVIKDKIDEIVKINGNNDNVAFIDEVHIDISEINDYGWNESGNPVIFDKNVPKEIVNKRITVIACVSRKQKLGYKIYNKSGLISK